MMHDGNVLVVPRNRNGVPVRFSDLSTVIGMTANKRGFLS
jgi:hypothetical protein